MKSTFDYSKYSIIVLILLLTSQISSNTIDNPNFPEFEELDHEKVCAYLHCNRGEVCVHRKFFCKYPPCPRMLFCARTRREFTRGPTRCDSARCSKGHVCVVKVRRCHWDEKCSQQIARCISYKEYHDGPASCAGFKCPIGSHCILREAFCLNPPCKLFRSCEENTDIQTWFGACRILGCPSEYECFLRSPDKNCSANLCKHTPDCIKTIDDAVDSEHCQGWICPRHQKCFAKITGNCKTGNCEIKRFCNEIQIRRSNSTSIRESKTKPTEKIDEISTTSSLTATTTSEYLYEEDFRSFINKSVSKENISFITGNVEDKIIEALPSGLIPIKSNLKGGNQGIPLMTNQSDFNMNHYDPFVRKEDGIYSSLSSPEENMDYKLESEDDLRSEFKNNDTLWRKFLNVLMYNQNIWLANFAQSLKQKNPNFWKKIFHPDEYAEHKKELVKNNDAKDYETVEVTSSSTRNSSDFSSSKNIVIVSNETMSNNKVKQNNSTDYEENSFNSDSDTESINNLMKMYKTYIQSLPLKLYSIDPEDRDTFVSQSSIEEIERKWKNVLENTEDQNFLPQISLPHSLNTLGFNSLENFLKLYNFRLGNDSLSFEGSLIIPHHSAAMETVTSLEETDEVLPFLDSYGNPRGYEAYNNEREFMPEEEISSERNSSVETSSEKLEAEDASVSVLLMDHAQLPQTNMSTLTSNLTSIHQFHGSKVENRSNEPPHQSLEKISFNQFSDEFLTLIDELIKIVHFSSPEEIMHTIQDNSEVHSVFVENGSRVAESSRDFASGSHEYSRSFEKQSTKSPEARSSVSENFYGRNEEHINSQSTNSARTGKNLDKDKVLESNYYIPRLQGNPRNYFSTSNEKLDTDEKERYILSFLKLLLETLDENYSAVNESGKQTENRKTDEIGKTQDENHTKESYYENKQKKDVEDSNNATLPCRTLLSGDEEKISRTPRPIYRSEQLGFQSSYDVPSYGAPYQGTSDIEDYDYYDTYQDKLNLKKTFNQRVPAEVNTERISTAANE